MAQSTARPEAVVDLQMVREFLERYFTIENDIKVLQQDKSALRDECKGRGLDVKTMTAAIAMVLSQSCFFESWGVCNSLNS